MKPLKLLIVTHKDRPIDLRGLFAELGHHFQTEIMSLDKSVCKKLKKTLTRDFIKQFDKILLDVPFKYLYRQASVVNVMPDVTIYEEDATQNFIITSRWCGQFLEFYKRIPHAKIINTGAQVSYRFRQHGVDSYVVPKGFDPALLWCTNSPRFIDFGFIGTVRSNVYEERKKALEYMQAYAGLEIMRTHSPAEYREKLNSIRVFFSADIGLGEYMAKNFEAMACGCILLAYRQGNGEEEALGLVDGVNCLLYGSMGEAEEKLSFLHQQGPEFMEKMREISLKHAQSHFTTAVMAEAFSQVILRKPACSPPPSFWKAHMLPLWQRL